MTLTPWTSWSALFAGSAVIFALGCSEPEDSQTSCQGGKCDDLGDPSEAGCFGRVVDSSGTGRSEASILGNHDHFARFVLAAGDDCPTLTDEVMAKLNQTDGCNSTDALDFGGTVNGAMVVNEKSSHDAVQPDANPDPGLLAMVQNANRAVVSRRCKVEEDEGDGDGGGAPKPCSDFTDVGEVDFVVAQCGDPAIGDVNQCFLDNSGPTFFSTPECVSCLFGGDDVLTRDDLDRAEDCVERSAIGIPGSGPEAFNLLFSVFAGMDQIAQDGLEVIAFDDTEGVFNYYKENQGTWAFMGNSEDFQEGRGGFCKNCHPSGGLVQKELPSPWMNWEIAGDVPHAPTLIQNHPDVLGGPFPLGGEGLELEIVRPGNDLMNNRRVERLTARVDAAMANMRNQDLVVFPAEEVKEILKPLFCTEQITMVTDTFASNGIFTPDLLKSSAFISLPGSEYSTVIEELGQVRGRGELMSPDSSSQLARPTNGDVFDNEFQEGLYPKMINQSLLSAEFVQDLHFVDFTRPLFSDDRCELLDFAPSITVADLVAAGSLAAAIDAGFTSELSSAGTLSAPAQAFLDGLEEADGTASRDSALQTFSQACEARRMNDARAFMTEIVTMVELMRQETEERLEIIEGFNRDDVWPSIPSISLGDFQGRWNPQTCELE